MTFLVNGVNLRTRYFGKSQFTPTGQLYSFGYNLYGQLGNNSTIIQSSPVQIGSNIWAKISCGYYHTAAIQSNGTLWAWGLNSYGGLGTSDLTSRSSPVQIGSNLWTQVACGDYHTLARSEEHTSELQSH